MSGHSKWATTKHKKAVIDARRGKMFAKLIKNIEVAARMGGGDPAGNPTLYDAIQKAKKSSVPNDNIDRAVKRGSGAETGGADYQTIMYEGYGPAGVALLIECLTDNRNRAAMEVRTAMTRNGGSLADPGSVSFLFNRKGVVIVPVDQDGRAVSEDDILEATLDAGADDVNDLGDSFEVVSEPTDLVAVRSALQAAGIDYDSAEASFVPDNEVELDEDWAGQGLPPHRGPRGPRRRTERLRQLRRVRRDHGGVGGLSARPVSAVAAGAFEPARRRRHVRQAVRDNAPDRPRTGKVHVVVGPSSSRRASGAARATIRATARLSLMLRTSTSATPLATRSSITALASAVPTPRRWWRSATTIAISATESASRTHRPCPTSSSSRNPSSAPPAGRSGSSAASSRAEGFPERPVRNREYADSGESRDTNSPSRSRSAAFAARRLGSTTVARGRAGLGVCCIMVNASAPLR